MVYELADKISRTCKITLEISRKFAETTDFAQSCLFMGDLFMPCPVCLSICNVCVCDQTVGFVTMTLCMQVGLVPGHIVLDGGHSSPSLKGAQLPNFRPISLVANWLDGLRCHLVWT